MVDTRHGYFDERWDLEVDGETYTLAEDGVMNVSGEPSLGIQDLAEDSTINVLGWLSCEWVAVDLGESSSLSIGKDALVAGNLFGVYSRGGESTVTNFGTIRGAGGYYTESDGGELINRGLIEGGSTGVGFNADFNLVNSGLIRGLTGYGVSLRDEGIVITNEAGGKIVGAEHGIRLGEEGRATIVNDGTIRGLTDDAIFCDADASVMLTNRGTIVGGITLGDMGNIVDTRGGTVQGPIIGGAGDDIYRISSNVDIRDFGPSTSDQIYSSVSYSIAATGIDDLFLTGSGKINATGNSGHNVIAGNRGNNRLDGMGGTDNLIGGKGNDVLRGGDGGDFFEFRGHFGKDVIKDFQDGIDRIVLGDSVEFNDLRIRRSGDDVLIQFGHGDLVKLEDFEKSNLTADDFLIT